MSSTSKTLTALKPYASTGTSARASYLNGAGPKDWRPKIPHPAPPLAVATQRSLNTAAAMTPNQPDSVLMDKELNYLRKIVKDVPYIFEKATKPEPREFVFPLATLFKAPTREIGLGMKGTYADALHEHGIAGIELGFEDPDSKFMLDLVDAIGCTPDTHSSTQGALWDITYPHGGVAGANGETAHSVSHSLGQFAWHTDGSYEPVPQRYLGFHIMRPDRQGGGVFRVLRADDLISLLSPSAAEILSNTEFDLKVPAEFYKGVDSNKGKLLQVDRRTGRAFVRFRRDILLDPPSQDPAANRALEELVSLLDHPDGVGEHMPEYVFKENTVLLVDNARYLHSRTDIKDPKRWLRRVRFQGSPGGKKERKLTFRARSRKLCCGGCYACPYSHGETKEGALDGLNGSAPA